MPIERVLPTPRPALFWAVLLGILVLALLVRLVPVFLVQSIYYPDEIFQATEQAHRLVFGRGFVPWEFEIGLRSWIYPGILAGIMEVARWFDPQGLGYLQAVGSFMALCSLSVVVCGFLWGYRVWGLAGAAVTGTLTALWSDLAYFASRTLSEVWAANFFVVAVYLAYVGRERTSPRRFLIAGALFGCALVFRVHLAPAIAVAALWTAAPDWRRLPWMVAGGIAPLLISGLVDALTWGEPFQSIWLNVKLNLLYDISSLYGRNPWYRFLANLVSRWSGGTIIILGTALFGARRLPLLGAIVVAIFATHLLIVHKEVRFLYPAAPFTMVLCGIGTMEIIDSLLKLDLGWKPLQTRTALSVLAVAAWLAVIASMMVNTDNRMQWLREEGMVLASHYIAEQPDVCGIGVYDIPWALTGGYTHLHRPVPYFDIEDPAQFPELQAGFNVMLYSSRSPPPASPFLEQECWSENGSRRVLSPLYFDPDKIPLPNYCVARRPGGCADITPPPQRSNRPPGLPPD